MNHQYGAWGIHQKMLQALKSYLNSQYFGRSPLLLKALQKDLDQEEVLFRRPYIESTPAYKQSSGIDKADLPDWLRNYFIELANAHLGVFAKPYTHQIKALESAIRGKDLLVATGTGSGKTECFMWPIMAKLISEAHNNPDAWQQRGVRTIIMYPLNALVSDQLSRLRRLLGDQEGKFETIFEKYSSSECRRPQFGMYTGRTPYPGPEAVPYQDKRLANTLSRFVPQEDDGALNVDNRFSNEYISELSKQGRIPAKRDLAAFIAGLLNNEHRTDPHDAELLTRFECQQTPPDILITNYSMLEYMLLRPREGNIWFSTKEWLKNNPTEKLLFIIDEAHMYRGSSGGEVALLIQRLFNRLGITRDRVQFIMTTASMPSDQEAVEAFARALTNQHTTAFNFEFFYGERSELPGSAQYRIPVDWFQNVDLPAFDLNDSSRLGEINRFASYMTDGKSFSSLQEAQSWLGDYLPTVYEFRRLIELCRGRAASLDELASDIFPEEPLQTGLDRVSALLAIAPLAQTPNGVLFPARMHMLFRGLKGVYACMNPDCPEHVTVDGLSLGKVMLKSGMGTCPKCGHGVYELENDRRCGALFLRGYLLKDENPDTPETYLWPGSSAADRSNLTEISLYLPPEGFVADNTRMERCFLNTSTGYLSLDDSKRGQPHWREMYYPKAPRSKGKKAREADSTIPAERLFSVCPHCQQRMTRDNTRTFSTRGSQAFFNLVQEQFKLQPSVSGKDHDPRRLPNEGRKVLIFSDSRQRAAKLARDMTDAADSTATRQIATRVFDLYEKGGDKWDSMKKFYPSFAKIVVQDNVPYLSGDDRKSLRDAGTIEVEVENKRKAKGRKYVPRDVDDAGSL